MNFFLVFRVTVTSLVLKTVNNTQVSTVIQYHTIDNAVDIYGGFYCDHLPHVLVVPIFFSRGIHLLCYHVPLTDGFSRFRWVI